MLEDDLRRNVSEDIVVIINRGIFRGHAGVRELAYALAEELPEHRAFEYTFVAAEERVGLLEWTYEDSKVRVRDGLDSYLIEGGKNRRPDDPLHAGANFVDAGDAGRPTKRCGGLE